MKDLVQALAILAVALFFGPIIVIFWIITSAKPKGNGGIDHTQMPPVLRAFLTIFTRMSPVPRASIAVVGMIAWLAVYIPLVSLAFQAVSPKTTATPLPPTLTSTVTPSVTSTSKPPPPTPTNTRTPTSTPTITWTPTPTPCVCQSVTDDSTLRCLIHTESEAANRRDLTLIQQIFAPDATIFRGDTGEEWDNPMAYYVPAFASLDFTEAKHFDIHQIEIAASSARYTSGSSGYYAESGATPTPYYNKNPSDHWVFGKNDQGCWVITRFEFNASHIEFP